MKTIYHADNTLDAYIVLNMLAQENIEARVEGEYLQGGIGELPPDGIVRVVVDEENVSSARAIIKAWAAKQPPYK